MKKTFELKKLNGNKHNEFLNLCFSECSIFSLTKNRYYSNEHKDIQDVILNLLSENLIKNIKIKHWFCLHVRPIDYIDVFLYEINNTTKTIINKYYTNLFIPPDQYREYPEDLCFFKNNKLLLGTVSHEKKCYLYPDNVETMNKFFKLSCWDELKYNKEQHINLELLS